MDAILCIPVNQTPKKPWWSGLMIILRPRHLGLAGDPNYLLNGMIRHPKNTRKLGAKEQYYGSCVPSINKYSGTLLKTNMAPEIGHPNRKQSYSNHPFSGANC